MTTAREDLQDVFVVLVTGGTPPPCTGRTDWTDDDPATRHAAATACTDCPALAPCAAVALAEGHRWGVWAGCDVSTKAGRADLIPFAGSRATQPHSITRRKAE